MVGGVGVSVGDGVAVVSTGLGKRVGIADGRVAGGEGVTGVGAPPDDGQRAEHAVR